MLYSFDADNNRTVIEAYHNHYPKPQLHHSHRFPFHDIFYLIEGEWSVALEDEEALLYRGDIILLPALLDHYGMRPCEPDTHTIFIHFSADRNDGKYDVPEDGTHTGKSGLLVQHYSEDRNFKLLPLFQDIAKAYGSAKSYKKAHCSALLSVILAELSDMYLEKVNKRDNQILHLISLIDSNPHKFFTIEELAGEAAMSRTTLIDRFKLFTGASIHKYQMDKKLDRIASILKNESYTSLKNIAENYGFSDEFHLGVSFKKKFSISPGKYGKILHCSSVTRIRT
jgi:AraC-like DNA-binding protein/mannose-6-phosphate isomerase-like protein (cupin superfamily)